METKLFLYIILLCLWTLFTNSTNTCISDRLGRYRILKDTVSIEVSIFLPNYCLRDNFPSHSINRCYFAI